MLFLRLAWELTVRDPPFQNNPLSFAQAVATDHAVPLADQGLWGSWRSSCPKYSTGGQMQTEQGSGMVRPGNQFLCIHHILPFCT